MLFRSHRKSPSYHSVLFVCTANITRSPSMEALFRKLVSGSGEEWQITSAGANAHQGSPPHPVISYILSKRGLSIARHRSKPVDKKLVNKYYWIIVAEQRHKESIINKFPDVKERITLFRELTTDQSVMDKDLPDPTGKEVDDYSELFSILDEEIPILHRILGRKISDLQIHSQNI